MLPISGSGFSWPLDAFIMPMINKARKPNQINGLKIAKINPTNGINIMIIKSTHKQTENDIKPKA